MGRNLFGIDVGELDVPAFLTAARHVFPFLALAWLACLPLVRRSWWLLLGVLLANAYVWGETSFPLQRLYALGPSHDRVGNVALCQVVAVGGSPLRTVQVGQLHFEPFWGVFVAALSGGDPERLLRVYAVLPLVMACGFALSLYFALRPTREGEGWSGWERALVAGAATLLSSTALDFTGVYRAPWALTFLLKPNHALGLVLFPWVLRAFAGIRGWRGRLGVGLLLHVLGWVFVLHMVYVSFGLMVYALLATRTGEGRRAWLDVAVVLGVNVLAVSPYLVMLFVGYPIFYPSARMQIPPGSAHLLEVTTGAGALFALAVWGALRLARRAERLGRLWIAQALGAVILWSAYFILSPLHLAKERDELFYWLRFLVALLAALGAWDLLERARDAVPALPAAPWARAALLASLALPYSVPYWWDPIRMDAYFPGSVPPLPLTVRGPGESLRALSHPQDVTAGDHEATRWAAALTGRRALMAAHLHTTRDWTDRLALEEALVRGGPASPEAHGVRYLLVTPALLARYPPVTLEDLDRRPDLKRISLAEGGDEGYVALYELRRGAS